MTEKYIGKSISDKQIDLLRKNSSWIAFCENRHGECYWNSSTGEIMWIASSEESNASLLPETWESLK